MYERSVAASQRVRAETPRARWTLAKSRLAAVRAFTPQQRSQNYAPLAAPTERPATPVGPGCHGLALFARVNDCAQNYVKLLLKKKWGLDAAKQAEAMQAWTKDHEEQIQSECKISTLQDGDIACYTPAAMLLRHHALEHPRVQELLEQWWTAATRHGDVNGDGKLNQEEYSCVYRLLLAAFDTGEQDDGESEEDDDEDVEAAAARAAATLAEDWARDCGDDGMVDREEFKTSIFELADQWTETCEPVEYISFLEELYLRVWHQAKIEEGESFSAGGSGAAGVFLAELEADEAMVEAREAEAPELRAAFLELVEEDRAVLREHDAESSAALTGAALEMQQKRAAAAAELAAARDGHIGFRKSFRDARHIGKVHTAYQQRRERAAMRLAQASKRSHPPRDVVVSSFKPFRAVSFEQLVAARGPGRDPGRLVGVAVSPSCPLLPTPKPKT